MPYKLRKAPNRDLYWVVAEDGQKKSKDPLPLAKAKAQMRALYASMRKEGSGIGQSKAQIHPLSKEQEALDMKDKALQRGIHFYQDVKEKDQRDQYPFLTTYANTVLPNPLYPDKRHFKPHKLRTEDDYISRIDSDGNEHIERIPDEVMWAGTPDEKVSFGYSPHQKRIWERPGERKPYEFPPEGTPEPPPRPVYEYDWRKFRNENLKEMEVGSQSGNKVTNKERYDKIRRRFKLCELYKINPKNALPYWADSDAHMIAGKDALSGTGLKGGATALERGIASYVREKYVFNKRNKDFYYYLSKIIHSNNSKPYPRSENPMWSWILSANTTKEADDIMKLQKWKDPVFIRKPDVWREDEVSAESAFGKGYDEGELFVPAYDPLAPPTSSASSGYVPPEAEGGEYEDYGDYGADEPDLEALGIDPNEIDISALIARLGIGSEPPAQRELPPGWTINEYGHPIPPGGGGGGGSAGDYLPQGWKVGADGWPVRQTSSGLSQALSQAVQDTKGTLAPLSYSPPKSQTLEEGSFSPPPAPKGKKGKKTQAQQDAEDLAFLEEAEKQAQAEKQAGVAPVKQLSAKEQKKAEAERKKAEAEGKAGSDAVFLLQSIAVVGEHLRTAVAEMNNELRQAKLAETKKNELADVINENERSIAQLAEAVNMMEKDIDFVRDEGKAIPESDPDKKAKLAEIEARIKEVMPKYKMGVESIKDIDERNQVATSKYRAIDSEEKEHGDRYAKLKKLCQHFASGLGDYRVKMLHMERRIREVFGDDLPFKSEISGEKHSIKEWSDIFTTTPDKFIDAFFPENLPKGDLESISKLIGKGKFKGGSDRVSQTANGRIVGGLVPSRAELQKMAKDSYKEWPEQYIGNSTLIKSFPTLKFYENGNTVIVAIRGSADKDDWLKNNTLIPLNQLKNGSRFQADKRVILAIQKKYPKSKYEYYGIAHSLGGALLDEFIREGIIDRGLSYNPAVQTQDFSNKNSKNERIYYEGDPLYNTMGRMLQNAPEVRREQKKPEPVPWWKKALSYIPGVNIAVSAYDTANNALEGHNLERFEGGGRNGHFAVSATRSDPPQKFKTQLAKAGFEPSAYLKEAQRRAKEHHLPYKLLGFATDGIHKLAIPDSAGKLILFGRVGYGDHLIYSHLEASGKVASGFASKKQNTFQRSHQRIKGDWKSNPFSPNNLALKVLW